METGRMARVPLAATRHIVLASPLTLLAAQAAHAAGMPQLDFHNPLTLWQVVWGAAIFALLYLLLSRSALPRVASVLADRQARIDGDLEAARRAKSESDRAIDELHRARREAAAEAQANLDRVVAEAREEATARARAMNARLDAELATAEAQIGSERQRALESLRGIAVGTTHLLVERVTGQPADLALVESGVDGALAASGTHSSRGRAA